MSGKRLTRIIPYISVLIFAANLFLFSIQSYIPATRAGDGPAYSADYCTPHKTNPGVRVLHRLIDGSANNEGVEKHRSCFSCCLNRQHFTNVVRIVLPVRNETIVYGIYPEETISTSDFARNLSSRSPPHLPV